MASPPRGPRNEGARGPTRFSAREAVRLLALIVFAGVSLWLSLVLTFSEAMADRAPTIALSWWSWNADAQAATAATLLQQPMTPQTVTEARNLAEAALRKDPSNVAAVRTLGILAAIANDRPKAQRLMSYAERLSRRDLPTQLWLIEDRVGANDIEGALLHYDRALRTNPLARDILFPILVSASADPHISGPLAHLLSTRPPWWGEATSQIIAGNPQPATLPSFIAGLRLNPAEERDRRVFALTMNRLVDSGNIPAAVALYRSVGGPNAARLLRDGDFGNAGGFGPFDWEITDEADLRGLVQPPEGAPTDPALFLIAENGRSGQIARQLLTLPPGRYQLSATIGGATGDESVRPLLYVTCADGGRRDLVQLRFPTAPPTGQRLQIALDVPQGCPAQWIRLVASSNLDARDAEPWIDAISIRPL